MTPGLIDLHAHVYRGATFWGIDADAVGSRSGVTCWIDAGSSGALTLAGLREFIIARSAVRIYALLNIAYIGLTGPDYELRNLEYCDTGLFEIVANQNRDVVLGVKVRMGQSTVGPSHIEPIKRAREAADRCQLPLMVHIATPPPELAEFLGFLTRGDIVTHCFTGQAMRIVDDRGRVHDAVRRAVDEGVILDIGHGSGSFAFATAEAALAAGLKPHVISTDIHQISIAGPMFDLPTCLTKFLVLGLSLPEVIALATSAPARALGLERDLGTLRPGALADIALFTLARGAFPLYDINRDVRSSDVLLRNTLTIVGGQPLPPGSPPAPASWLGWGRGGRDVPVMEFQRELARRGHVPDLMAAAARVPVSGGTGA